MTKDHDQNEQEWIRKAYQDYLRDESHRQELRDEKKYFIETHFSSPPNFFLRPVLLAPVLSILLVAIAIWVMPIGPSRQGAVEEPFEIHSVDVKRASSRVGPVMVYQKIYHEDPMTIVWVFPTGTGG